MTTRKIVGYIFIVGSIVLAFAAVGRILEFMGAIVGFFKIFSGQLASYQVGYAIGTILFWLIHISSIIFLWTIGNRWIKKQSDKKIIT